MASPMPETVTISMEEYGNLLMTKEAHDHIWDLVYMTANTPDEIQMVSAQALARSLLDEWSK